MTKKNPIAEPGKQTADKNESLNKNSFKSIGAILAGFVAVAVLSIVTDSVLESAGIFPPIGTGIFSSWMWQNEN